MAKGKPHVIVVGDAWVSVSIKLPKSLHAFMDKFTALEGFHAEDRYVSWIRMNFESFLDELSGLEVDMKRLIEVNGLKETLADRNPSFIQRIFHED
jgi:hypothetical protein